MLKRIKLNMDLIEAMLYFWQATNDREKVSEKYLNDVSNMDGLTLIYDNEFNAESVRKVLSAITNREPFSPGNKKEGRFWNNNMWMMEDLEYTNLMIQPLKKLNLDDLIEKLQNEKYEELEVIISPMHLDEYKIADNKLVINFFRVKPGDIDDNLYINEKEIKTYIEEKLKELL
ncbi:hypothetical protein [Clostridium aciditolerans]|uniref:Uncharacterized protein n=1 Tax=Clostridium aciditolerans TaxID=339861 RepID=A0A934HXW9_9CLOT|nr:hypothetical protein [Clostridium aciditolerans]MBI6872783.1 hypothetical protein [Clostridium aciditolerans]